MDPYYERSILPVRICSRWGTKAIRSWMPIGVDRRGMETRRWDKIKVGEIAALEVCWRGWNELSSDWLACWYSLGEKIALGRLRWSIPQLDIQMGSSCCRHQFGTTSHSTDCCSRAQSESRDSFGLASLRAESLLSLSLSYWQSFHCGPRHTLAQLTAAIGARWSNKQIRRLAAIETAANESSSAWPASSATWDELHYCPLAFLRAFLLCVFSPLSFFLFPLVSRFRSNGRNSRRPFCWFFYANRTHLVKTLNILTPSGSSSCFLRIPDPLWPQISSYSLDIFGNWNLDGASSTGIHLLGCAKILSTRDAPMLLIEPKGKMNTSISH